MGAVFPLAHVGGPVFEPLQVAALTLVATAYAFRAMTLARGLIRANHPDAKWAHNLIGDSARRP